MKHQGACQGQLAHREHHSDGFDRYRCLKCGKAWNKRKRQPQPPNCEVCELYGEETPAERLSSGGYRKAQSFYKDDPIFYVCNQHWVSRPRSAGDLAPPPTEAQEA